MQKLLVGIAVGVAMIAVGTFIYVSGALPMLGSDPAMCANCHVMDAAYENWFHAPHGGRTKCVDCHLPHDNVVNYWATKGYLGMRDLYLFSTGQIPDAIRAKPLTQEIVQHNCARCHEQSVAVVVTGPMANDRFCWDCHRDVAHGSPGINLAPLQDAMLYQTK